MCAWTRWVAGPGHRNVAALCRCFVPFTGNSCVAKRAKLSIRWGYLHLVASYVSCCRAVLCDMSLWDLFHQCLIRTGDERDCLVGEEVSHF